MQPQGRTVILSDTHLGKPGRAARSAKALFPLLEGADHLILNGDAAELHDNRYQADAARQMIELRDHCEATGIELTLIAGNHDPMITERRALRLHGRSIVVTHGDAMHPAIAPWAKQATRLRQLNDQAIASARSRLEAGPDAEGMTDEVLRLEAARHASHVHWSEAQGDPNDHPGGVRGWLGYSKMMVLAMYYWVKLPGMAFGYAARHAPDCRFLIFGHIHRPGVWERGGRVVINTGAFERPARPRGVIIEDGRLRVCPIIWQRGAWRWARQDKAQYPLPAASRAWAPRRPAHPSIG